MIQDLNLITEKLIEKPLGKILNSLKPKEEKRAKKLNVRK